MRKLLYGGITLLSAYCKDCGYESFVVDGFFRCCGQKNITQPDRWKRMSETIGHRRHFSPAFRAQLLESQDGKCFWCENHIFRQEFRFGKSVKKTFHVEHVEPFIYASNDNEKNIVAACSICNLIKSDLMFKDTNACREYIQIQRTLKGYSLSSRLSELRE